MPVRHLLPGALCLGVALTALLSCQKELALAPATEATRASAAYTLCALTYAAETARIQGNTAPYGFNKQAIKNGWSKYEESLEGSTQCSSCQTASDNAIKTAYNYYGGSQLQKLRDREDPYSLITPDNTFLSFTSFTHRSIGQVR